MSGLYDLLHGDFLQCGVCTRMYTDPVILPCLHTACQTCVQRHLDDSGVRQCPVCQQQLPATDDNGHRPVITPNYFLVRQNGQ